MASSFTLPFLSATQIPQTHTQQGQNHHITQPGSLGSSQMATGMSGVCLQHFILCPLSVGLWQLGDAYLVPMSEWQIGWRKSVQETGSQGWVMVPVSGERRKGNVMYLSKSRSVPPEPWLHDFRMGTGLGSS